MQTVMMTDEFEGVDCSRVRERRVRRLGLPKSDWCGGQSVAALRPNEDYVTVDVA